MLIYRKSLKLILKNTPIPSILVESGFLSNKVEANKLNSKKYQKQIAKAIYKGTIEYFKSKEDTETHLH